MKCLTCGQTFGDFRVAQEDGTCNFCHEKYDNQKDNYGNPKWEYVKSLQNKSEEDLMETTERMIWLSAYANNNPRSDYHYQCDACYDEWIRRENPNAYEHAWKRAAS